MARRKSCFDWGFNDLIVLHGYHAFSGHFQNGLMFNELECSKSDKQGWPAACNYPGPHRWTESAHTWPESAESHPEGCRSF